MSLFNVFDISASAMQAQSTRLNTVASNLANADAAVAPGGQSYRSKQVIFQTVPSAGAGQAVQVAGVTESEAPARRVFEPTSPLADADGFVTLSNVNVVEEMVNMLSAARSYQTNVEVMNAARTMLQKALTIGQ